MDVIRRQRLDELPATLAVALRLQDAGHDNSVVATALDVPVEGVPALLQVARAKLDHLRERDPCESARVEPDPSEPAQAEQNQWSTTEGQHDPGA